MTAARVLLSDGEVAWVRGLHPVDVPAVRASHVRLSDRDRYYRFFGPGPTRDCRDAVARRAVAAAAAHPWPGSADGTPNAGADGEPRLVERQAVGRLVRTTASRPPPRP